MAHHYSIASSRLFRCFITAGLLALVGHTVLADGSPWWDTRWPWRRLVIVGAPPTGLAGSDAAWAELLTHGVVKPDGSGIRVATASGQPVKSFVMQSGPDDRTKVCFAVSGQQNRYYIYYGNPQPDAAPDTWRPERGVLLEGWTYRGGQLATLSLTQQAFEKAGPLEGRTFVPQIFLGHNPFGVPVNYCHKYTGWLNCDKAGSYTFCTSSKDASFLLVDDQMVVQWPGTHQAVAEVRYTGKAELKRGLHKLTYLHVAVGAEGRAVAAWQPPGTPNVVPIPPTAFAPLPLAVCSDLDRYGSRVQADFTVEGPFETFFQNRYTFRYVFTARVNDRTLSDPKYEWDFGDGQTAERESVEHVYLTPGIRPVTLTLRYGGRPQTLRNRLAINRDWNRTIEPKLDPVEAHARIVGNYRFAELPGDDLLVAMELLRRTGNQRGCLAVVDALINRTKDLKPQAVIEILPEIYKLLVGEADQAKRAVEWFQAVETGSDDVMLKATAAALAGRALLEGLGDNAAAEKVFNRVVQQYGDRTRSPAIRQARIGLGDVFLHTGRYRMAQQAYEQAGTSGDPQKRNIQVGSRARAAEDYIRRKEYADAADQLDLWESEYPEERLRGHSTLMRATLLSRQKRYQDVIRLLEGFPLVVVEGARTNDPVDVITLGVDPARLPRLYRIDPTTGRIQSAGGTPFPPNPCGMEMALLAADACAQLKKSDKAQSVLHVAIRLYPDSPLLRQAKDRLKELGGS